MTYIMYHVVRERLLADHARRRRIREDLVMFPTHIAEKIVGASRAK